MHLFKEHAVADPKAVAGMIPVIDYGPLFRRREGCAGAGRRRGRARLRECRVLLCAEPRRSRRADRPRLCRLAPVPCPAARREAGAPAQRQQYRLFADQRFGAGRLDRPQGDPAEPERELFHQPRPRARPSRRGRRQAVARPQPVADGAARHPRADMMAYFDALGAMCDRMLPPFAVALGMPADFFAPFLPTRRTPICASCTIRRRMRSKTISLARRRIPTTAL